MNILQTLVGMIITSLLILLIFLFFIKLGWALFIVPVFNLPELTWTQAFGSWLLVFSVSLVILYYGNNNKD